MPRRREVPKRVILPDPKFHDLQIAKFINMIMRNGKKSTAEKIMYFALDTVSGKSTMESVELMEIDIATITLLPYDGRLRYAQAMPAAAKALENDL
jgi:small subunit ribosomal protein S7